MSVYGGFATRALEMSYGRIVENLIFTLQKRVVQALKQEFVDDERFTDNFRDIWKQLGTMEQQKFHPPKFSLMCVDLANYFGEDSQYIPKKKRFEQLRAGAISSKRSQSTAIPEIPASEEIQSIRSVPQNLRKIRNVTRRKVSQARQSDIIAARTPPMTESPEPRAKTSLRQRPKLQSYYDRLLAPQLICYPDIPSFSSRQYSYEGNLSQIQEKQQYTARSYEHRSKSRQQNNALDLLKPLKLGYRNLLPR